MVIWHLSPAKNMSNARWKTDSFGATSEESVIDDLNLVASSVLPIMSSMSLSSWLSTISVSDWSRRPRVL
jgi:hypothetical protein